jgi:hypothetical protein
MSRLNSIAIGLKFVPQRLKITDEIVDFARPRFLHLAQQLGEVLGRPVAIVTLGLLKDSATRERFVLRDGPLRHWFTAHPSHLTTGQ